jgi:uncharacterized protein YdeI (YjbR/CyaY-like superfamily)
MGTRDPRVDAYIAKSADFAKPILVHLRDVIHAACPDCEETLKWSAPAFMHHGILCMLPSFKEHCALVFWKGRLIEGLAPNSNNGGEAMGNFGRITSIKDLPSRRALTGYLEKAMRLNEEKVATPRKKAPRPPPRVPAALASALAKNRKAKTTFEKFSPSHRRDYIEWIDEAKREETRVKRVAQTVEWLAEGKSRNWKHEKR